MVSWSLRFVLWQAAAFLLVIGWCWVRRDLPRFRSPFGLRFAETMASEEEWRGLHRAVGRMSIALGAWLLVPLTTLADVLLLQVLPVAVGSFVGVGIIRWRRVRRRLSRPG